MELKHLLSIVTVTLTALGAILYSIGAQHAVLAVGLWMAAILSLVVTDFLGVFRLPRIAGNVLMWCVLIIFLLQFLIGLARGMFYSTNWQLQNVVNVLIFLQLILLFQDKDARAYGWLTVMSLLQVVVAARFSRGVAFGSLLIGYAILGIFALSLLAMYGQRKRAQLAPRDQYVGPHRWPLAGIEPEFTSTLPGSGRSGIVPEYFARLALIVGGGLLLAMVIFYAVPRPRIPFIRWGDTRKSIAVVGFNDKIELEGLSETFESREEVMRVRFREAATNEPYPLRAPEIYLRGTAVDRYSENKWSRTPPGQSGENGGASLILDDRSAWGGGPPPSENDPALWIGDPVIQEATVEPYLERTDLFYVWPLIGKPTLGGSKRNGIENIDMGHLLYEPLSERLFRKVGFEGVIPPGEFSYELTTSGLADGIQPELVPARHNEPRSLLREMPKGLPQLNALAERWRREAKLPPRQYKEIAECFERQLSSSGQFHYSLQPVERDDSIDAVEDFVSNHPSGHCEYFATALALMLRSQKIPSRVVLGYRCDEWDPKAQCFQVRQLHAHAWVEAFLDPSQIPRELRQQNPKRWIYGGWLRLDATPAAELGSTAANRTTWGTWEGRFHAMQHCWERYIADMDQDKQRRSVYTPIREFTSRLFRWETWRELLVGAWHALARLLRSGIMGKLAGTLLLIAGGAVLVLIVRRLARLATWLWRRLLGGGGPRAARARSSVAFYHPFEQVVAQRGLFRRMGQTPREFARAAGARLAMLSGRPELCDRAAEVAEAFYSVRFGRQELDAAAAEIIQKALEELKAGVATPRQATD